MPIRIERIMTPTYPHGGYMKDRRGDAIGRARDCARKQPYSRQEAEAGARRIARTEKRTGQPAEAYECRYCGFWHIGHPRQDD